MQYPSAFRDKLLALARLFPKTFFQGVRQRDLFREVQTVCLFIGYPRSGHTLIGSLLDAHPEAVIAHEMDLLRFVYARFFHWQMNSMMLANSRLAAAQGVCWSGYSYAVPGQWQGRFRKIKVIGDKHGEATAIRLHLSPWLLDRLPGAVKHPVKMLHVIRNPYDNIATIARKSKTISLHLLNGRRGGLEDVIDYYFMLCDTVNWVRQRRSEDILDVHHERFVAAPLAELERICGFLELPVTEDYLRACSSVVYTSPRLSRNSIDWPPELISHVQNRIQTFSFLQGYSFDA